MGNTSEGAFIYTQEKKVKRSQCVYRCIYVKHVIIFKQYKIAHGQLEQCSKNPRAILCYPKN